MKALPAISLLLLSMAVPARGASAANAAAQAPHSTVNRAPAHAAVDPLAPVYIVTSRKTFDTVHALVRDPASRRDSLGNELVVSETKAHMLDAVSGLIHQRELRCGGFFAFTSRAEADRFIANDRSALAARALTISYTIDNAATVDPWLPQATESGIYDTINTLQGYKNRYYASSYGKSAAEWIKSRWESLAAGRGDVTTELFTGCTNCSTQPSVILTIQGNELPNEVVVLGAHLDSINQSAGGNPEMVAPGADDDASGIATLTEALRIALASGWKPQRTVKFMAYAAEETGLRGSNAIAQQFKANGINVVGALQLDMTEYQLGTPEDMQLVTDYSNASLKLFFNRLFDAYLAPMGLRRGTITCGYGCSDHASWTSAGYPAAMMFEAGDNSGANTPAFRGYNPNIHTTGDTLSFLGESAEHSVKFAQFALAFIGEVGKTSAAGPTNAPPVANFRSKVVRRIVAFTDRSSDSDGSIVSRSWNFGDGKSSTATSPTHVYSTVGTYNVTLTVTDDDGATASKTSPVTIVR
ncbi:M20/M25/M40 family metallo-hydrolase [Pseudoluteimonas lycopersici]|nr:M20/M25/M40 family metallo-hydrolase [Lysobacter lycopersici]